MGYKVDYGSMRALQNAYSGVVSQWNSGISAVVKAEGTIEASTNIDGNRANRMKEYLNSVYSSASASLSILLETFQQNYLLYLDNYYSQIDAAGDAQIDEQELSERRTDIQEKRSLFQQIGFDAENAVGKIADLVSLPSLDFSEPDTEFSKILTSLDDLDSAIQGMENTHVSADFADIDALIEKLNAYFIELIKLPESFKTDFSAARFGALASVPALYEAVQKAYDQMQARESDVTKAQDNLKKRIEQEEAEYEARKARAEWAKIGFGIFVGAISAVALATAGPVGVIVYGTLKGASSALFNAAADEYVEHGFNTGDWDMDRIKIRGCVGAVSGLAGSLIPAGMGSCAKAAINGTKSALVSAANASYDQLAAGGITDTRSIIKDSVLTGAGSFVGDVIGDAVSEEMEGFVKQNKKIKDYAENVVGGKGHFGAVLAVEGAAGITSGIANRFSSTATEETGGFVASIIEGKSVAEAYDEHNILSESISNAIDPKSIVSDVGDAVSTAATDDPLKKSLKKLGDRDNDYYMYGDSPDLGGKPEAWDDWDSEEYDRLMDKLAAMDEGGKNVETYDLIVDQKEFARLKQSAIDAAWERERQLVLQGKGTRDWSVSQQEELIRTGKVSGFYGHHMLDASNNPSVAANPDNIQFLNHAEHYYGAHADHNTREPTLGRFDPATGETTPLDPRQIPHREKTAFELTDKFDYRQADVADQLGPEFGYGRGKKSK